MTTRATPAPAFVALVLACYAWLFPWVPALRSPNELSRLYQARALVEDHALSVNDQIARHGAVGDLSLRDGRYYPNKAPGVSFLGAAAYGALRLARGGRPVSEAAAVFWLRLLVCMAPGALAAELVRQNLRRRFDPALSTAGALVFALGTIFWPYSTLLMSHGPSTAAVVAAWWALENARDRPPGPARTVARARAAWWALAGFLSGWAVLLEYTSALALPPLFAYGLAREHAAARGARAGEQGDASAAARGRGGQGSKRVALAALLGFAPPLLLLGLYHQAAFGHPLHTGYQHLVNPVFARWHARGFLGVGAPSLRALGASFLDPARGLFAWCPFLALGVPGLVPLYRRDHALALLCGAEIALYALFTAGFTLEAWGWVVGPRHITPACAFLLPPALAAAEWLRNVGVGFAAAGLALFGSAAVALTMAVCPYLPEELTNPLWQLVVPLARAGLRSPDALARAIGMDSAWTLAPWGALVIALFAWTVLRLSEPVGRRRGWGRPVLDLAAALAVALAFAGFHASAGGPDHFDETRSFIAERLSG